MAPLSEERDQGKPVVRERFHRIIIHDAVCMSAEEAEGQGLMLGWEHNCEYVTTVKHGLLCVHDGLIVDLH
jgi:hypothetical protein